MQSLLQHTAETSLEPTPATLAMPSVRTSTPSMGDGTPHTQHETSPYTFQLSPGYNTGTLHHAESPTMTANRTTTNPHMCTQTFKRTDPHDPNGPSNNVDWVQVVFFLALAAIFFLVATLYRGTFSATKGHLPRGRRLPSSTSNSRSSSEHGYQLPLHSSRSSHSLGRCNDEPNSLFKPNDIRVTSRIENGVVRNAIPPAYTQNATVGAGVEEYNGPGY